MTLLNSMFTSSPSCFWVLIPSGFIVIDYVDDFVLVTVTGDVEIIDMIVLYPHLPDKAPHSLVYRGCLEEGLDGKTPCCSWRIPLSCTG